MSADRETAAKYPPPGREMCSIYAKGAGDLADDALMAGAGRRVRCPEEHERMRRDECVLVVGVERNCGPRVKG